MFLNYVTLHYIYAYIHTYNYIYLVYQNRLLLVCTPGTMEVLQDVKLIGIRWSITIKLSVNIHCLFLSTDIPFEKKETLFNILFFSYGYTIS